MTVDFTASPDRLGRAVMPARGVSGIYLIWSGGREGSECLLAGAARDIGDRLVRHARDPRIARHAWAGTMRIDWAAVASIHRPGALDFIARTLAPRSFDAAPAARPIAVNLPA